MTRLLYVEDNEDNAYMLSRRLRRRGYEVAVAADGAAGLQAIADSPPDLVLMDLGLPVVDGWTCIRRLKGDPVLRRVPIIALSAHAMASHREKALVAGADDFDTKPVDLDRLAAKIEALLDSKGAT